MRRLRSLAAAVSLLAFVFGTQVAPWLHCQQHADEARHARLGHSHPADELELGPPIDAELLDALTPGLPWDGDEAPEEAEHHHGPPLHDHGAPAGAPHGTGSLLHGEFALEAAFDATPSLVDFGPAHLASPAVACSPEHRPALRLPEARAPSALAYSV